MIQFVKKKIHNLISDQKFSEVLSGSVWALSARVVSTVLGLGFSVIVARFYGADVVGILAVINSFLMLVTIFTVLGTGTSILRLIPEHLTKYSATSAFKAYRTSQYMVIGISVLTAALFFFSANLISDKVFSKPHLSYYFGLASLFVVFKSMMELNTQAVRGLRLIKLFALMQLLPQTFNLLFLITMGFFYSGDDVPIYAVLFGFAMTGIIGWLIMEFAFKKKMRPSDKVHSISGRKIFCISLPMLMASAMFFIIGQTGIIMLGIFRSDAEVGYYAIAVKLATLTTFVATAITTIAAPKFSELYYKKKEDELIYVAKKSTKLMFWTSIPILLVLIFFGKHVLWGLYGKDFIVAYTAIIFLSIGQCVSACSGATNAFMNMTGKQVAFRNIICSAALINVLLNWELIPLMGIAGSAMAAMASTIYWNIASLLYIKIKFGKTIGYVPFIKNHP